MLSHPLKSGCHLALIEKRHAKKYHLMLEKNRGNFSGILHFIDAIKSEEDTERLIMGAQRKMMEGKAVVWGIWHDRDIIGVVSVRDIDEELRSAEIGYFIDKDYEGRGLVSEACALLIRHVFGEFAIDRLVLGCDVNNLRSQRVAEKFHFQKEGVARKGFVANGKSIDCFIYSLLREEHEALQAGSSSERNEGRAS